MKELLINCFNDTLNTSNSILSAETTNAINSNKVYREKFISDNREDKYSAEIEVIVNTSFDAAKQYSKLGKVAVLNFANPHFPGGGVKNGAKAQEECLCRSSNLFPCLNAKNVYDDYYLYNRNIKNRFFSDRLIYTKNVTVFKDDSDVPQLMPQSEWFQVDVITCAAPYIANRKYTNKTVLKELFKSRIKNIFESAIDNYVDVLVLGAFGCGAFKNPPAVVAKAFHEVIEEDNYKNCFKHILFAIKRGKNHNADAFMKEFDIPGLTKNCPDFVLPKIKLPNGDTINSVEVGTHKAYTYIDSDDIKECIADGDDFFVRDSLFECDYERQCKFIRWQYHNKYFNKQFSILGDSISTLAGYNPKGYKVFFDESNGEKASVHDMNDTWWGKVIDFFGGELLVNNSWSGSRVTGKSATLFPSGCSNERTSYLHMNGVKPNVIIIYFGFNDWANGVALDDTHVFEESLDYSYFARAYNKMLENVTSNYPNAEIWCCTLNTTYMSTNQRFKFPYMHGGIHIEEYNREIKQAANNYNCKIADLYKYNTPYDTIDGSHPNADGMNTLATLVIKEMATDEAKGFMNC